jgi:formate hydrogenlyase subunit 3/multisubunit Na+/H+ antiporter MnhD subunit
MEHLIDLARAHAPLLAVGLPLIGAALAFATPHARLSWLLAVLAALATCAVSFDMGMRRLILNAPALAAHEGVALTLEGVSAFAAPAISAALALVIIAGGSLTDETRPRAAPHAWALALCVGAGWIGALLASDFVGVVLAVEIAWLAGVGLFALSGERQRGALNGALRMLTVGGVAAALALLGAALVTRATGGHLASIGGGSIAAPSLATAGMALIVISLAVKAGAAPLHMWSAAAYGRGGSFAVLVVGAVGTLGALAVLARVTAIALSAPDIGGGVSATLAALGLVGIVVASVQAVGAANVGRLAAYASASQAGGVLLGLALGSPAGLASALVQMIALAVAMLALLGGAAAARGGSVEALDGLVRRAPIASVAISAGALSLMGAPLTTGFLGRWRLIEAGLGAGWWWAAGAALVTSLAAVFYGGRLIERVFFRHGATAVDAPRDLWRFTLVPLLLATIVAIAFGFAPALLLRAASNAALLQLGHTQ